MRISELDTPALLIDLDVMERNLRRVADYARSHGLRLRPHTKTHKIPSLGRKQVELGAAGLTVAKVGEAEVMVDSGTPDLLVAYPVIGRRKLERLTEVARKTRVTVSLDSVAAARQLSDAASDAHVEIRVLVETDVGLGRVGVRPGEELRQLAQSVARLPWLAVEGIAFYPGHIKDLGEDGERQMDELARLVEGIVGEFRADGLPLNVVSGGSTPTLYQSHRVAAMNEIRPGTYIFNDRNIWAAGGCALEDCAASILTTVVSTARPGFLIIDGGSKTFFSDRLATTGEATFGYVREAPEAIFYRMNEEHGYLDLSKAAGAEFQVGDRLRVIPNHICVAMNLHEQVYGVRGEEVAETWRVEGRGKLQ
jgi:D-serine deaminase-like pyridoxal phosphate-dependent protein